MGFRAHAFEINECEGSIDDMSTLLSMEALRLLRAHFIDPIFLIDPYRVHFDSVHYWTFLDAVVV